MKDIKLSNMKGFLIFLVVFGHLIELYQENYNVIFLIIYSFHMPLFILISGYFAKRVTMKKVINLMLLYLMFQPLYYRYLLLIKSDKVFEMDYKVPFYHLWYLVSMIAWYLIAIVINKRRFHKSTKIMLVAGCVLIGFISRFLTETIVHIMINYDSNFTSYSLSFQRTLSFLPFFVLGLLLSKDTMRKLYHSLKAKWVVTVLAMTGVYTYFNLTDSINKEKILKGSYGVYKMKGEVLNTSIEILIGYLIAFVLCYLLLNVISKKERILTKWGDRSLAIFLFHPVFVMYIKQFLYLNGLNRDLLFFIFFVFAILICILLSSDIVTKLSFYICNPIELVTLFTRRYQETVESYDKTSKS